MGLQGSALFDATLFGILGFFILRKHSRVAAVLAMLLYGAEMIGTAILHGNFKFTAVMFFLLVYLFHGVRGTFAYAWHLKVERNIKVTNDPASWQGRRLKTC
jgi:hypothetical protein